MSEVPEQDQRGELHFVANNQESAHMIMWRMSDRNIDEMRADDGRIRCAYIPFCLMKMARQQFRQVSLEAYWCYLPRLG